MKPESKPSLRRSVNLPMLIFYGLGNIFGAGIYVLIGAMAGIAGTYIPLSFLLACVVVLFTALSYAELSARYPMSAGEAIYIEEGFHHSRLSTFIGLSIACAGLLSSATILHGFHGYLSTFIETPQLLTTSIVILLIGLVAIWGITESITITMILTLLETLGLGLVIYVGFGHISWDIQSLKSSFFPEEAALFNASVLGAFLAFYAFIGFEDMVNIAEEVKNPTRTMPRAIIITLIIATLVYVTVALVSISVVSSDVLAHSNAPLAQVYEIATGSKATILSIIALFAVINGALIQIIMASRIFYGMSAQGWLPAFLSTIHPKTHTPVYATILAALLVFVMAAWLPILTLAQSTSFIIFLIFTLVNLALIRIKQQHPHPKNIRTYPMAFPVIAIILNLIILGYQIVSVV